MKIIAGVDEVGRGPLAGPVYAAAVVLPKNHTLIGLEDSKKISKKKRELLFIDIKEQYKQKEHRLELFKSQQNRSYFQKEQIKGFHTEFQCSKKNIMLTEQFNIKQYFK